MVKVKKLQPGMKVRSKLKKKNMGRIGTIMTVYSELKDGKITKRAQITWDDNIAITETITLTSVEEYRKPDELNEMKMPGEIRLPNATWRKIEPLEKIQLQKPRDHNQFAVNWPHLLPVTPVNVFRFLFPNVENIVEETQKKLPSHNFSQSRFWRWLGVTLSVGRNISEYWKDGMGKAKFKMSFKSYKAIMRHLVFSKCSDEDTTKDKWSRVRQFINSFNINRRSTIYPCCFCVDESSCKWRGRENRTTRNIRGCPAVTKSKTKPEGVACQLNTVCDGCMSVLLGIEICEGEGATNEYDDVMNKGSAIVMRMVKPWKNENRLVVADSRFASVELAACLRRWGMHFIGCVKTCTSMFPIQNLRDDWDPQFAGESVGYDAIIGGTPLIACAWSDFIKKKKKSGERYVKKIKRTFISTCFSMEDGMPHVKKKTKENEETQYNLIKRPKIVGQYYRNSGSVDFHNHMRQGGLQLEKKILTKDFFKRLFLTIVGMIEVDSYIVYKHLILQQRHQGLGDVSSHRHFTNNLIDELLK